MGLLSDYNLIKDVFLSRAERGTNDNGKTTYTIDVAQMASLISETRMNINIALAGCAPHTSASEIAKGREVFLRDQDSKFVEYTRHTEARRRLLIDFTLVNDM